MIDPNKQWERDNCKLTKSDLGSLRKSYTPDEFRAEYLNEHNVVKQDSVASSEHCREPDEIKQLRLGEKTIPYKQLTGYDIEQTTNHIEPWLPPEDVFQIFNPRSKRWKRIDVVKGHILDDVGLKKPFDGIPTILNRVQLYGT